MLLNTFNMFSSSEPLLEFVLQISPPRSKLPNLILKKGMRQPRSYIGQGEHKEMLAKAEEEQEGKEVEGGG